MNENEIGTIIVDTAIDLHRKLGPGLMENVYEVIFMKYLINRGLNVQRQVSIPVELMKNGISESLMEK